MENQRSAPLDVLRGTAILMMVFSGVQPYAGALPAWMYHAQVPPPAHVFDPALPGITWVDLVFPFFLFSMGAAIPLSLPARMAREGTKGAATSILRRFLLLLLFAILSFNFAPLRIPESGMWAPYIGILGYAGLFLALVEYPGLSSTRRRIFRLIGWGLIASLAAWLLFVFHLFDPAKNDPIIRVLAHVYLAGTGIWLLTRYHTLLRSGFYLLVLALYLGSTEKDSWVYLLWNARDPWNLLSPMLLKYLLIFLPGTLLGDQLSEQTSDNTPRHPFTPALIAATTGIALWAFFSRHVAVGFALVLPLCGILCFYHRKHSDFGILLSGTLLLTAGFLLDPFQGGIKKDHATLSYFFASSGLAFLWVTAFLTAQRRGWQIIVYPLALLGQNALLAYLMAGFLWSPLFDLSGLSTWMGKSLGGGLLKAVFITGLMATLSAWLAKKKVFWKM